MRTVSPLTGKIKLFTALKERLVTVGSKRHDVNRNPTVYVAFARQDYQVCPVRSQCTRSQLTGRSLTLWAQSDWQVLQQARAR